MSPAESVMFRPVFRPSCSTATPLVAPQLVPRCHNWAGRYNHALGDGHCSFATSPGRRTNGWPGGTHVGTAHVGYSKILVRKWRQISMLFFCMVVAFVAAMVGIRWHGGKNKNKTFVGGTFNLTSFI